MKNQIWTHQVCLDCKKIHPLDPVKIFCECKGDIREVTVSGRVFEEVGERDSIPVTPVGDGGGGSLVPIIKPGTIPATTKN